MDDNIVLVASAIDPEQFNWTWAKATGHYSLEESGRDKAFCLSYLLLDTIQSIIEAGQGESRDPKLKISGLNLPHSLQNNIICAAGVPPCKCVGDSILNRKEIILNMDNFTGKGMREAFQVTHPKKIFSETVSVIMGISQTQQAVPGMTS